MNLPKVINESIKVGIEIEAEGYGAATQRSFSASDAGQWWQVKPDGSLRSGGVEFCSIILEGKDVAKALTSLEPTLRRCRINWRAGIHVHVNVRDKSVNELINIAVMYSLLEPIIFKWEGNDRHASNFCVPWYVASDPVETLANCVNRINNLSNPTPSEVSNSLRELRNLGKYSALNLIPITSFGTIEFRMMESTKDISKIMQFVNLCAGIVDAGTKTADTGALSLLSGLGPKDFFTQILGNISAIFEVADREALVWQGVATANALLPIANDTSLIKKPNRSKLKPLPLI